MGKQNSRSKTRLGMRLSNEEYCAISSRARQAGLSKSEYVRRRSLEDGTRPIIIVETSELRPLLVQVKRIGGNINQLARAVNTLHRPEQELPALAKALDELGVCIKLISDVLEAARKSI